MFLFVCILAYLYEVRPEVCMYIEYIVRSVLSQCGVCVDLEDILYDAAKQERITWFLNLYVMLVLVYTQLMY